MESWKTINLKAFSLSLILAAASFSIKLEASNAQLRVDSLAQGSCWVENSYPAKVASFNESSSFIIEQSFIHKALDDLEEEVISKNFKLDSNVLKDSSYHLHCSSQGVYLVINALMESQHRLCAWYNVYEDRPQLSQWGISEGENFCFGLSPGQLIVGLASDQSLEASVQELIEQYQWSDRVEGYERVTDRVGVIYINESFWGEEKFLADELRKTQIFNYIDLESYYWPVGESIELFE